MTTFSSHVIQIGGHIYKRVAQDQGGLLSGKDPTQFNTSDPLRLWAVQLGVILVTTNLLAILLGKIRQPKVLAEIIGGIILGPTVMGRIPGFTQHIFPPESRPYLSLVADIGLVLFLFIIGLEIDVKMVKRNLRTSMIIAGSGMLLPFGLGAAIAVPLYHQFINPANSSFGHFLLFVGVAFSITAFPVLCRILTSLKLLDTTIGVVVLSAGVFNDVVGWILLALTVALVNATSGLTALWVLLVCVGWVLFLLFPVKRVVAWIARKTGSIENGPTTMMMTMTILLVFGSAFFTDIIGVNAIFGGFLVGLIIPREGGLAIALTEKLEDMVSIIFLPLYFTLSGLSTNLGLLNTGTIWGFTIAICVLAYTGKITGGTLAARLAGFQWREASAIGTLMSCKGLIELIVLNIGLNAGILDTRVFSMFVLEALTLTFLTTPVLLWIYPPHLRKRSHNVVSGPAGGESGGPGLSGKTEGGIMKRRFTFVIDKLEHIPALMSITQLLQPPPAYSPLSIASIAPQPLLSPSASTKSTSIHPETDSISIDALRIIELSSRTSDVMRSEAASELLHTDPLLSVFRTFAGINRIPVSSSLAVVPLESLAATVAEHAKDNASDLVVLSWAPPRSVYSSLEDVPYPPPPQTPTAHNINPFEALFRSSESTLTNSTSTSLIRRVFSQSSTDVALYVDRTSISSLTNEWCLNGQEIILPFFGGPDDRVALDLVVQLCCHPGVRARVLRVITTEMDSGPFSKPDEAHIADSVAQGQQIADALRVNNMTLHSTTAYIDTFYPSATTQTRLASETTDNITWARYTSPNTQSHPALIEAALSRVSFTTLTSSEPLHALVQLVLSSEEEKNRGNNLVVVGRARRMAVETHHKELSETLAEYSQETTVGGDIRRTVGDTGAAIVAAGCRSTLLVVQAAVSSSNSKHD